MSKVTNKMLVIFRFNIYQYVLFIHLLFCFSVVNISAHSLATDSPLVDETLVQVDGVIRVGVSHNIPLAFFDDDGNPQGVFIDILDAIADEEAWYLEYVSCAWTDCLEWLENGEIAILASIAYSEERDQKFDFNEESVFINWGQVQSRSDISIQSIFDLEGRTVATPSLQHIHTVVFIELLNQFDIDVEVVEIEGLENVLQAIHNKEVDAGVTNRLQTLAYEGQYNLHETPIVFNPVQLHFAVSKGENSDIIDVIDIHLRQMKFDISSAYHQSYDQWFGQIGPRQSTIPQWVQKLLLGGSVFLMTMVGFIVALRYQVRIRTQQLQQSRVRYQRLFNGVNDAIFVYNLYPDKPPSTFVEVNNTTCKRLGYTRKELLQKHFSDIGEPLPEPMLKQMLNRLLQGDHIIVEATHIAKDGARIPVEISSQMFELEGEPTVLSVARDMTERRQLQEDARKAELLQLELDKERELVELKDRILSIMSHDFRTPLSIIQTSSDLMSKYFDKVTPERRIQLLQQITKQVATLTGMIDDILMVARGKSGQINFSPADIDLDPFCRVVFEQVQFADEVGHQFEFVSHAPELKITADGKLLQLMLNNLLSNAVKFSPEQSRITFELDRAGDHAVIRISDEGIGVPEADILRLFEAFHRADNVGNVKGTGLGLSIVKQYVELHGGRVEVKSKEGQGSTFTVLLPVEEA